MMIKNVEDCLGDKTPSILSYTALIKVHKTHTDRNRLTQCRYNQVFIRQVYGLIFFQQVTDLCQNRYEELVFLHLQNRCQVRQKIQEIIPKYQLYQVPSTGALLDLKKQDFISDLINQPEPHFFYLPRSVSLRVEIYWYGLIKFGSG